MKHTTPDLDGLTNQEVPAAQDADVVITPIGIVTTRGAAMNDTINDVVRAGGTGTTTSTDGGGLSTADPDNPGDGGDINTDGGDVSTGDTGNIVVGDPDNTDAGTIQNCVGDTVASQSLHYRLSYFGGREWNWFEDEFAQEVDLANIPHTNYILNPFNSFARISAIPTSSQGTGLGYMNIFPGEQNEFYDTWLNIASAAVGGTYTPQSTQTGSLEIVVIPPTTLIISNSDEASGVRFTVRGVHLSANTGTLGFAFRFTNTPAVGTLLDFSAGNPDRDTLGAIQTGDVNFTSIDDDTTATSFTVYPDAITCYVAESVSAENCLVLTEGSDGLDIMGDTTITGDTTIDGGLDIEGNVEVDGTACVGTGNFFVINGVQQDTFLHDVTYETINDPGGQGDLTNEIISFGITQSLADSINAFGDFPIEDGNFYRVLVGPNGFNTTSSGEYQVSTVNTTVVDSGLGEGAATETSTQYTFTSIGGPGTRARVQVKGNTNPGVIIDYLTMCIPQTGDVPILANSDVMTSGATVTEELTVNNLSEGAVAVPDETGMMVDSMISTTGNRRTGQFRNIGSIANNSPRSVRFDNGFNTPVDAPNLGTPNFDRVTLAFEDEADRNTFSAEVGIDTTFPYDLDLSARPVTFRFAQGTNNFNIVITELESASTTSFQFLTAGGTGTGLFQVLDIINVTATEAAQTAIVDGDLQIGSGTLTLSDVPGTAQTLTATDELRFSVTDGVNEVTIGSGTAGVAGQAGEVIPFATTGDFSNDFIQVDPDDANQTRIDLNVGSLTGTDASFAGTTIVFTTVVENSLPWNGGLRPNTPYTIDRVESQFRIFFDHPFNVAGGNNFGTIVHDTLAGNIGVVAGIDATPGDTTVAGNLTVAGNTTLDTNLTGFLRADAGVVTTGTVAASPLVEAIEDGLQGGTWNVTGTEGYESFGRLVPQGTSDAPGYFIWVSRANQEQFFQGQVNLVIGATTFGPYDVSIFNAGTNFNSGVTLNTGTDNGFFRVVIPFTDTAFQTAAIAAGTVINPGIGGGGRIGYGFAPSAIGLEAVSYTVPTLLNPLNLQAENLSLNSQAFFSSDTVINEDGDLATTSGSFTASTNGGVSLNTGSIITATGRIQTGGGLRLTGIPTGTLATPPTGLAVGDVWHDTTDDAMHPILRVATVTT